MKKPYQIESERAVKELEAMAADGNPAVQMVLPMAEMVGWLRQGVVGVGPLVRLIRLVIDLRDAEGSRAQLYLGLVPLRMEPQTHLQVGLCLSANRVEVYVVAIQ